MTLKKTPLNEVHKKLGARMVEFGGWEMPVQYSGVIEEHKAVRNSVGLFDISHMGEVFVTGREAESFVNHVTTNDVRKIGDGGCQYAACCYENGGIVDDVISYRFSPQKYLIVVNASNTDKDFKWFLDHKTGDVAITNESNHYFQLALQGPLAEKVLQPLVQTNLASLGYYRFCKTMLSPSPLPSPLKGEGSSGVSILLSRTGYTGEDGFEIYGPSAEAERVWNALLEEGKPHGIQPIGLGARDTLRLEAALSLYGHEISADTNPFEARLKWVVKLDKPSFIGKESLQKILEQGVCRTLVGLSMVDPGIPRQGYEIVSGGRCIGRVTSGTFSPTLAKPIAMALVEKEFGVDGTEFSVMIRGKEVRAKVVPVPFYRRK